MNSAGSLCEEHALTIRLSEAYFLLAVDLTS
jgi:hypothetical protein